MIPIIHELKTWPEYFRAVKSGLKTFEIRINDRDYQIGDELLLKEFVPNHLSGSGEEYYTGQICHRRISYILQGGQFGLEAGYVCLGLTII